MARLKLLLFSPALLQTGREEEIEEVAVTRERTSSAREYPRFFTVPILALTYPQRLALTWKQEDTVAFKKT